jgi:hypothetical protein
MSSGSTSGSGVADSASVREEPPGSSTESSGAPWLQAASVIASATVIVSHRARRIVILAQKDARAATVIPRFRVAGIA